MLQVARRVRLTLPGTLIGLATSVAAQDDPPSSTAPVADATGTAWVEPVVPEDWEAPQEPTPADEDWKWDADGLLSLQGIYWGDRNASDNDLQTKTATVVVTARHDDDFLLWFEPDFDGEDTRNNLSELWGEWTLGRDQWLRVGQFKVALGTEFATRAEDLLFVGYAYPTWIYARYDSGVRYDAYANENLWWEALGTVGEGFDLNGEKRSNPLFMLRGTLTPDQDESDGRAFEGLFGGAAVAYSPDGDDHVYQATPLDQTTFTTPNLDGEDQQFVHWEVGVREGRYRFGLENVVGAINDVPTGGGTTNNFEELSSWAGYVAWNFTGDAPRWERGGWAPYTPADYAAGKPLPIELGFRYSNSDIDRDLFNFGFTTEDPSSQETRTMSTSLSAYLNPNTRLALQWLYVIADHELTTFDGENRTSNLVLRWDQWFGRD